MTEEIKLHTERLIVRSPRVEDAQDVFTLMKDKNTAMITGFAPMSDADFVPVLDVGYVERTMDSVVVESICIEAPVFLWNAERLCLISLIHTLPI